MPDRTTEIVLKTCCQTYELDIITSPAKGAWVITSARLTTPGHLCQGQEIVDAKFLAYLATRYAQEIEEEVRRLTP